MPYSDCCGYHTNETDLGICPRCKEHCDWEPDEDDEPQPQTMKANLTRTDRIIIAAYLVAQIVLLIVLNYTK